MAAAAAAAAAAVTRAVVCLSVRAVVSSGTCSCPGSAVCTVAVSPLLCYERVSLHCFFDVRFGQVLRAEHIRICLTEKSQRNIQVTRRERQAYRRARTASSVEVIPSAVHLIPAVFLCRCVLAHLVEELGAEGV